MIVTIDGPAGSGKSTAARGLARRLGFEFLDTGAMYRVVAETCLRTAVDLDAEDAVAATAEAVDIRFDGPRVFADGVDVTEAIRSAEVTRAASLVAVNPGVRRALAEKQRRYAEGRNIVTEGRDQGTDVFPHARCKFFLLADEQERARRRHEELTTAGSESPLEDVLAQIRDRDQRDESRPVAPLRKAEDAIVLDTTGLSPQQVLRRLEEHVRARLGQ
ncbi:MAG: (d)CMP kinase [Planctomycetes bacterium]|nr:(d)CMP kinase [Planctomycetota bacterium]